MQPTVPNPVKYFIGFIYSDSSLVSMASEAICKQFSNIDFTSEQFDFRISDYYKTEMGWPLFRCFVSLETLMNPGDLAKMKIATNKIEDDMAALGKRRINLDPGYMDFNKVVLASAKFNGQKIYLCDGIYADPTLWYERGRFEPYSFAFPDFKSGLYQETFLRIRALYKKQLRELNG